MTFWTGLLLGWIVGSVGAGIVLMFFAGAKRYDSHYDDPEERLKGRRE